MDATLSIGRESPTPIFLHASAQVDPLVALSLRYQDLILKIESPDTDDDEADRFMSEAMDIEAVMMRMKPISIAGYVAVQRFAVHLR